MTVDDLALIHGLTFLGENDDLQESEIGFRMKISILAPDGLFTDQVSIEVRCPQINHLIIFNQAVVYRLDGEDIPPEVSPNNLQKTLEAIISSYKKNQERKEQNAMAIADLKKMQMSDNIERARSLIIQAAVLMSEINLGKYLQMCGDAYSLVHENKGGVK